eukprot:4590166-Pleurochrysis_carterae.AAC.1
MGGTGNGSIYASGFMRNCWSTQRLKGKPWYHGEVEADESTRIPPSAVKSLFTHSRSDSGGVEQLTKTTMTRA